MASGFAFVRATVRPEIRQQVLKLLNRLQLRGFEKRYPAASGGQRRRAAAGPRWPWNQVLLLDEPFGALDARVRQELRLAARRAHEMHVTSILVTHDQEEA